ncbi:NADH dehydrogenase [ubiquinone] 1 alpha subcomplex assembly factor, partial [Lachnellula willkommii]
SPKPRTHDRGPASTEDTQTDFSSLNVLGNTPAPSTSIDACAWDGFHLNSGVKVVGGKGVLLVNGEAFGWCPWEADGGKEKEKRLVNVKGQFEVGEAAWGVLGLVWPKPDLLILGLGKDMRPISPKTRQYIQSLGIRVDVQDTRNAAAQFNLLATERGVGSVAAALIPMGFREGVGV